MYVFVKEDYYLTPDKLWIPLRWIAPELLEEYRGSLIVTDQTKTSNVWYVLKLSQLFIYSASEKSTQHTTSNYDLGNKHKVELTHLRKFEQKLAIISFVEVKYVTGLY